MTLIPRLIPILASLVATTFLLQAHAEDVPLIIGGKKVSYPVVVPPLAEAFDIHSMFKKISASSTDPQAQSFEVELYADRSLGAPDAIPARVATITYDAEGRVTNTKIFDKKLFYRVIKMMDPSTLEKAAKAELSAKLNRIATVRGAVNGLVTFIVTKKATGSTIAAVFAGSAQATVAFELQKHNGDYNRLLRSSPFWDPNQTYEHQEGVAHWMVNAWRAVRHAGIITGIWSFVFLAQTAGHNAGHLIDSYYTGLMPEFTFNASTLIFIPVASLGSALSWGWWKQIEADSAQLAHRYNATIHVDFPEIARKNALDIEVRSQVFAVVLSGISVLIEGLVAFNDELRPFALTVMTSAGVLGAAVFAEKVADSKNSPTKVIKRVWGATSRYAKKFVADCSTSFREP